MKRTIVTLLLAVAAAIPAGAAQRMTRTLKDKPAVVLTAFGTSTRAQATYDVLERQVRDALPNVELRWAFTSEIIRERVNARWAKKGKKKRLRSLQQALADLQADGYTKVVVQPIHIFPGEEYEEVLHTVQGFPGLRIETGETLFQRWATVRKVLGMIAPDFLSGDQGCNVLVAHGSPQTHVGSNLTYLGLDRLVARTYENVFVGTVEGILGRDNGLEPAKACAVKRVRFIPLMYVAGDHIMNDIMGEHEDPAAPSWREEVEAAGLSAETPTVERNGKTYYKGLGFRPEVNEIFIDEIQRALSRL